MKPKQTSEKIAEAWLASPLGMLKIVADDDGIRSISFAEESEILSSNNSPHPMLQRCVAELREYFSGRRRDFSVPLTLDGSSFQCRVWEEVMKIPYGRTVSYREIAEKLGDLGAVRAVGAANGANKIPIIIPCHRVIGNSGELTGYAGGIVRKQKLLQLEQGTVQKTLF